MSKEEDDVPPYWVLISVLFSSFPMTPALAMCLHHVAFDLHQRGASEGPVAGDLVSGKMVNLKKDVLLGTTGGPAFEAEIDTERGSGTVRFFLTRAGMELMGGGGTRAPQRPKYLN